MNSSDHLKIMDNYTLRARLFPSFLVGLPLALALFSWAPEDPFWSLLGGVIVSGGATALLAQIGRDMGKYKQPQLYKKWGGKPSIHLLQHKGNTNKVLLDQRHKRLQELLPGVKIPTYDEEAIYPRQADQVYEVCNEFLLRKTRDQNQFPLIFQENCNYGFRRNLWGIKPVGIIFTILALMVVVSLAIISLTQGNTIPQLVILAGIIDFIFLLMWVFWITPNWVRIPAEAYAERLLEACLQL
jgi:hypothetical protein